MSVQVVVAHYKEDLEWVHLLKYPTMVISKSDFECETIPNRGNEASSYLQYIIGNYDHLSTWTIFVHGHRTDWHHTRNTDEHINEMVFEYPYYNINEVGLVHLCTFSNREPEMVMRELFPLIEGILETKIDITKLEYKGCGQFYVHRDLILRHPKQKYIELYQFLMTTPVRSYWSGRIFEYLWHFIFTGDLVDRR